VLRACTERGIGFIPWRPISSGELAKPGGVVYDIAEGLDATPSQVALAWLLQRSSIMLPIPGTSSLTHLEENVAAAGLKLDLGTVATLDDVA
jgi:aryl-alcohol dehydrogenase-like predicted oxidoreductase